MPSLDLAAAVVPRRGIDLATLAEEPRASDVGLEFLTGELQGTHDPSGVVFTVLAALSGMEREYIRDRTLEGHESARRRGTTIGGAGVTNDSIAVRRLEPPGAALTGRRRRRPAHFVQPLAEVFVHG
ncbi:recombinase family protein [Streptomyces hygroscopicus]|uniref:recombinase family protein n=1 Tax=Streptomyces hygroscopicus TaxID=1912 RepID=UPI0037A6D3F0